MEDKDENGSTGKSGHFCNLSRVRPIGHVIQNLCTIRTQQDRIGNKVVAPSGFGKPGHQVKGHTFFIFRSESDYGASPVTRDCLPGMTGSRCRPDTRNSDDGIPVCLRYLEGQG